MTIELKPTSIDELAFELRDTEIFKIPDVKTRIATVQNYFFPRLELLLMYTIDLIQDIYGVNPYEEMTFVYRPNNRKNALQNSDFKWVHIGLTGKRRKDRELKYKRNGKPTFLLPAYLIFVIDLDGSVRIDFSPFGLSASDEYVSDANAIYRENFDALSLMFEVMDISHSRSYNFVRLKDFFAGDANEVIYESFNSPTYYFPTDIERGLWRMVLCFISLYPLLDAINRLGEGKPPRLAEMLSAFKDWYIRIYNDNDDEEETTEDEDVEQQNIPDLDSYSFIRAGLWWSVLARDNWTCCSCGRSSKDEGIILEVDHIVPRSKGGSNDMGNLQTLCKKCNIGKSNKDDTDLRRINV